VIPALVDQFQAMVRDFPHYMANLQHRSASFRQITDRFHLTTQANTPLARRGSCAGRSSSAPAPCFLPA
jgi:hypothetical protein